MARLHGFPEWFRFNETKWHGARQIGNSVPPPLARAVANQIKDAIGAEFRRPMKRVKLGNEALLRMSLAQAAAFWGIVSPIGQRDGKSGAKTSKQARNDPTQLIIAISQ